ncbi:hypothetical protein [Halosegnis sp.]|uniref:hypothetical protein n=1 Tax=Halosegnis sp. TaxID=2864959 RepID=UPI0035D45371
MTPPTRRRVLAGLAGLVGTAGCSDTAGEADTPAETATAAPVPTTRATAARRVRPVVTFDGPGPVNLAVGTSGAIYLAMSFAGTVRRLPPGKQTATTRSAAVTDRLARLPAGDGGVYALAVHDGRVYAALNSHEMSTHGIWTVPTAGGTPQRLAAVSPERRLRGLVADPDHERLLVSDARKGAILTVRLADGTVTPWLTHRRLAAERRGPMGLALAGDDLSVTHSDNSQLLETTVQPTGTAIAPTVRVEARVGLSGASGVAVDGTDAYIAATGLNRLVGIDGGGRLRTIATTADGLNVPTDVALGADGDALFVTNFGFKPLVGLTGERSLLRVPL